MNYISLGGDLSGSVDFNGSQNVTITGTLGNSDTIRSNLGLGASDNVEFNNVTVGGSLNSDDITATNVTTSGDLHCYWKFNCKWNYYYSKLKHSKYW